MPNSQMIALEQHGIFSDTGSHQNCLEAARLEDLQAEYGTVENGSLSNR